MVQTQFTSPSVLLVTSSEGWGFRFFWSPGFKSVNKCNVFGWSMVFTTISVDGFILHKASPTTHTQKTGTYFESLCILRERGQGQDGKQGVFRTVTDCNHYHLEFSWESLKFTIIIVIIMCAVLKIDCIWIQASHIDLFHNNSVTFCNALKCITIPESYQGNNNNN